ncbi:hypothetical protein JCM3775_007167 [Rhodotorula graminis]
MSEPVASTSASSAPPPRPSSTARRLPGAWARPTSSSSSSAHRRVDRAFVSDVGAPDGGGGASRRSSGRALKRPRASSSLDGSEQRAGKGTSPTRWSVYGEPQPAGAARTGVEASPDRGPAQPPRAQPATRGAGPSSSQASSHVPASSFTPSYIRDRYAAPSTSAPRPSAPSTRRHRPALLESRRGPAPLALLFDGQDDPPGAARPPPRPPPSALAPAPASAPDRPHVPPSLLFLRTTDAGASERARRAREEAEAEEHRRRSVWTAAAKASSAAVAPTAPPVARSSQPMREELQRAPQLEQVAPASLSAEDERELRALFSPPPSPSPSPPPALPPVEPSPYIPPTMSHPPPSAAPQSRSASPELFLGLDNSPRQSRQAPPSTRPIYLPCPPSTTSDERTDHCPSRSTHALRANADERSTTTESAAALSAFELSYEPDGSPELVMGMSVEREKPSRPGGPGGTGPPRRAQQAAAAAAGKGKGRWMKRRTKGKAWTMLEPEDTWWTRDLGDERAMEAGPGQSGRRALQHEGSAEQSLELTLRQFILPAGVVPRSALETGRILVDLHLTLHRTPELEATWSISCERQMRVGLVAERVDSADPPSRTFRLEHPGAIPLHLDPVALAPPARSLYLSIAVTIGQEQLVVRQVVNVANPFPPFSALLPFRPRPPDQSRTLARHDLASSDSSLLVAGIVIVLAAQPVPDLVPPTPLDITSLLSARLDRLALHRQAPSGVWVPDGVAVRSPATNAMHERRMLRLDGGAERPAFDFLTKVPHAPGELVRVFAHDSVEATRAAVSSKDEEITRSSMTPNEKLLARMQVRWCLVNPYPPTVYHRERACWVHYAPLISRFNLRSTLAMHLVRHLLAHKLVTQPQLREIVRAVDREVERVEAGEREGYDDWRGRSGGAE